MTERISKDEGRRAGELSARLAHDVGKYLARTARNLPPGADGLEEELLGMLLRDLYGSGAGSRPGLRFAELRQELAPLLAGPELAVLGEAAAALGRLDAIEAEVRAGAAVAEALRCALLVETKLRQLARELSQRTPPAGGKR
jgi:hypothetical protein